MTECDFFFYPYGFPWLDILLPKESTSVLNKRRRKKESTRGKRKKKERSCWLFSQKNGKIIKKIKGAIFHLLNFFGTRFFLLKSNPTLILCYWRKFNFFLTDCKIFYRKLGLRENRLHDHLRAKVLGYRRIFTFHQQNI